MAAATAHVPSNRYRCVGRWDETSCKLMLQSVLAPEVCCCVATSFGAPANAKIPHQTSTSTVVDSPGNMIIPPPTG